MTEAGKPIERLTSSAVVTDIAVCAITFICTKRVVNSPPSVQADSSDLRQGDLSDLPQPFYVQRLIHKYAQHLGLDGQAIAASFPI
jgi:hypothetical protein